jgi:peptidoglycan/LPS O-acetylase OafA/YrhL
MLFKSKDASLPMMEVSVSSADADGRTAAAAAPATGFFRDTSAERPAPTAGHVSGASTHTQRQPLHAPGYRPDIDGLRAIAVLSVLGFHAFPSLVRGGYVGVDLFFVISGFLISSIIFESLEAGRFSYATFYARRIKRIFPALALVLCACLGFGWFALMPAEYQQLGKHIFTGATFVSNIALWRESGYFDNTAATKPLLHLWSLGIEEQFYIFWPMLVGFAWKRRLGFLALTAIIGAASFAVNMLTAHADPTAAFYSPFSRFWELMIGGTLAYLVLHKQQYLPQKSNGWSIAGLLLVGAAILLFDKNDVFPGWRALLPTVGAFLIIGAGPHAWINRNLLSNRVVVYIGLISYPLYLWHWPLLSLANIADLGIVSNSTKLALLAASFVLAMLTYHWIERPLRAWKNDALKIFTLCAVLAALAALGAQLYRADGLPSRAVAQNPGITQLALDASIRRQYAEDPCHLPLAQADTFCKAYNSTASGPLMVVWGDSHAGAWLPVFAKIAHERNLRLMVISHLGCPPLLDTRRSDGAESGQFCSRLGLAEPIVESIHQIKPAVVFLVARWSLYSDGWISDGELQKATHFVTTDARTDATQATSRAALASQLPLTVKALLSSAPRVVVFQNPPVLKGYLLPRAYADPAWVEPTAAASQSLEAFNRAVVAQLAALQGVKIFDPMPALCDGQTCKAVLHGVPVYEDDNHMSAQGAILFEHDITGLL